MAKTAKRAKKSTSRPKRTSWAEWCTPEKLLLVENWAFNGLFQYEIAENIGIGMETFHRWKRDRVEFREALKRGREVADAQVENALFLSATGGHMLTKTIYKNGESFETEEQLPPNTTAQIFYLKNRKPEQWREKQEIQATVDHTVQAVGKLGSILEQLNQED